ncbi:GNAT family N-acetyltransferase [Marinobacter daepoensis]|uniref:L-ornithine N(alpha)-acyltransferase n=1 Tax=Marinobacter daepoensis TaxID=262077 RepID=A0ABS3BI08_9GAMM|nr:GNAT family N-acetyltransferase [Marinobacter daepoensis]MBN7771459.1 GNAT family N-acetyltransferase [Marinobacter daepoensis]MBY6034270.1 GNAT family N-acetyltransferase [Marinobacter daepoensis]MBY6080060.1 GNAT family N-acetyltransferase [Marinobacter daepoensis]
MTANTASLQPRRGRNLTTELTRCPNRIEEAQRLRYRVFSEEYGSDLGATTPGIDADAYDAVCDHLIVTDTATGELVATTRILHEDDTGPVGGFYSRGEFELEALGSLSGKLAELGRTCVHPDYRNGGTITLLWSAVADYLVQRDVTHLIGCASISMADGGAKAWHVARLLQQQYLCDPDCRVMPKRQLPHLAHPESERAVDIPPLIRAYMRLGAKVCGEPCWDPEFRCADMLVLLEVSNLAGRYNRHFMRRAG